MKLTDEQVLAAAAQDRLVFIQSVPGSGKTSVAVERYGYLRYQTRDSRGVLGLAFNRAAVRELHQRIMLRWSENCIIAPHQVTTFDQLHLEVFTYLLSTGKVLWLDDGVPDFDVRDDYRGLSGFCAYFEKDPSVQVASLKNRRVVSSRRKVTRDSGMMTGIKGKHKHIEVLRQGIISHGDVRSILSAALKCDDLRKAVTDWFARTYRALVADEIFDANDLDISIVNCALDAGLSITLIGDPYQTLYAWRGAKPELVHDLVKCDADAFVFYKLSESFRFEGEFVDLAQSLRAGNGVVLSAVTSREVDVAIARKWADLWSAGDSVLPLAFKTMRNEVDAALSLLLDVVTRARLGRNAFWRDGAIAKLKLAPDEFDSQQDRVFASILEKLKLHGFYSGALDDLCQVIKDLGVRKPRVQKNTRGKAEECLRLLAKRLGQDGLIPGLTVFQAKGQEWDRVGIFLTDDQIRALESGLAPFIGSQFNEEHCIIYVAVTRAKRFCGVLRNCGSSELGEGGGVEACGDEEHSESVVGGVAVASGGSSAQFYDFVDGFGGSVADSVGVELG